MVNGHSFLSEFTAEPSKKFAVWQFPIMITQGPTFQVCSLKWSLS